VRFDELLHPRSRLGQFTTSQRHRASVARIKSQLPRLDGEVIAIGGRSRPPLRQPTPAQTTTELALARTFGFTRPLGRDANGNYLVAAGGQRHSIDQAGRIVRSARVGGKAHTGTGRNITTEMVPGARTAVGRAAYRRYHVRHEAVGSPSSSYLEPPSIPEGMTVAQYRVARGKRGKHSPGVDWKYTTDPIPAFGGDQALTRISDAGLRNLLALRGFPPPRKRQVQAEMRRRAVLTGAPVPA
jgi:hypothetical protein